MEKKFRKIVSVLLLICMVIGCSPAVYGAEADAQGEETTVKTEQNGSGLTDENSSNMEGSGADNVEDITDSKQTENGEAEIADPTEPTTGTDEPVELFEENKAAGDVGETGAEDANEQSEKVTLSDNVVDYVYIESPYLQTPDTQRIVFAFEKEIEGIDAVMLSVMDEAGNEEELPLSEHVDGLYLFEKEYTGEAFTGTYSVSGLKIYTADSEEFLSAAAMGIEAEFGVNEEYSGIEKLQPIEEDMEDASPVGASVVTINEDGTTEAQDSIEDALKAVSADMETNAISTYSANGVSGSARSGNIVVALDPGHDSTHAGASGNGLREEVLTLKIANYCKEELEQYSGVSVYMTRTNASCPYPGGNSGADIAKRVEAAARAGAQIFVSFHLNSSTSSAANGAEIIVPNRNWKPGVGAEGEALAREILDELVALGLHERSIYSKDTTVNERYEDGSLSDYFAVQIYSKEHGIPGIIVEHAFISNSSDANNFLKTEAGLKKLGVADATGIAQYLGLTKGEWVQDSNGWKWKEDGKFVTSAWRTISGSKYYFNSNGYRVTSWQTISGKKYYFNQNGVMQQGWQTIDGKKYYFLYSDPGVMVTGFETIGGKKYFFNDDGVMQQGWQTIGGKKYYFLYSDPGVMVVGFETIGGKEYYFNSEGVMQTGWQTISGKKYYFFASGVMATGWQEINGKKYYFDEAGVMSTGWKTIDGEKYYFLISDPGVMVVGFETIGGKKYYFNKDGIMQQGWQTIEGEKYYFLISDPGVMVVGFETIGGKEYYFDNDGIMQSGWQTIGGSKYYFFEEGVMATEFQEISGKIYYFGADGVMRQGWQTIEGEKYYFLISDPGVMVVGFETIGGKKYYFNEDGVMQQGWQEINGKKYYFLISDPGVMVTGWETIGGKQYYFDAEGVLQEDQEEPEEPDQSGWKEIDGKKYYFGEDGIMKLGWQTIDGKKYYFLYSDPGVMVAGFETIGGKKYYFNEEGVMQQGWQTIDGKKYYFLYSDPGVMVTGFETIGGKKYYFNEDGVMQQGWQTIEGEKYYFLISDPGVMVVGFETIGGKKYYFNENGVMQQGWQTIDGKKYYFLISDPGVMVVGFETIGGKKYYFNEEGIMQTGWQTINGNQYYFLISDPGVMVTGWETIGGVPCYFNSQGILEKKLDGEKEPIEGTTKKTASQMAALFKSKKYTYPSELTTRGAKSIDEFCEILVEEAAKEGIRAEVVFAQAMLETGWLQYGGQVSVTQCNFAGIGAVDGGASGATFPNVRTGLRAQVQHLKAYANKEPLNEEKVDPRFELVTRGCAPYVEWLGIQENPNGYGWASGANYGYKIINIMDQI